MLRRLAANHIIMPDGQTYDNHVVELAYGRILAHYPLRGEVEATEWYSGTIIFLPEDNQQDTTENAKAQRLAPYLLTARDGETPKAQPLPPWPH